ncbi:MAG: hypothetical protein ABII22_01415 [Candidatus Micrarchaeota archaeon]
MKIRFILHLMIFIALSFATMGVCEPGFVDDIQVRAIDAKVRPIEGALVYLTYSIAYDKTAKTKTLPTNSSGLVEFMIYNTEQEIMRTDCDIGVNGIYQGQNITKTIGVGQGRTDLRFNTYKTLMVLTDQNGAAIKNAKIIVDGIERSSGETGWVTFDLAPGNHIVFMTVSGEKIQKQILVEDDSTVNLRADFYPMKIRTIDEYGKPVQAEIEFLGKRYQTDENGEANFKDIMSAQQTLLVTYGGSEKTIEVDLSLNKEYEVIFDKTPPEILLKTQIKEKVAEVLISVKDAGGYASGVVTESISLKYEIDGSGNWKKAVIYPVTKDQFKAEIPKTEGSIVSIVIDVSDKEGNKQSLEARLSIPGNPPVAVDNNQTKNETAVGDKPPQKSGLPIEYVAGGVILLIVFVYGAYRLWFRKE